MSRRLPWTWIAATTALAALVWRGASPQTFPSPAFVFAADAAPPADAASPAAADASLPLGSSRAAPARPVAGQLVLASAVSAIESHGWISARARHESDLYGQRLRGEGVYQQGPALRMRFEMRTVLGKGPPATLLQVCDGAAFWTCRDVLGEVKLGKIDGREVFQALRGAKAGSDGARVLGLGGLPQMLRSIAADFELEPFDAAGPGASQATRIMLLGTWRREALQRLFPAVLAKVGPQQPVDWNKMPADFPQQIELHLGAEDLFPYQIRYLRAARPAARAAGMKVELLLSLEFFDVEFGRALPESVFRYEPAPTLEVHDGTREYIAKLGLKPTEGAKR